MSDQRELICKLEELEAMLRLQGAIVGDALALLRDSSMAVQTRFKEPLTAAEHVKLHRPGKVSRIDGDAELRAFVIARIDKMTFVALAKEIALSFPPERRVGKSALHSWWQRQPNRST